MSFGLKQLEAIDNRARRIEYYQNATKNKAAVDTSRDSCFNVTSRGIN
ncbi:MAG: hypothetical protein ACI845_004355 [Gammaproteobacteria bacterium]|jgi:hypothetical protein